MPVIRNIPLNLDMEQVLRWEGIGSSSLRPEILSLLHELLVSIAELHLLEPAIGYELHSITEVHGGEIRLQGGAALHGKLLPKVLSLAEELAVVVCTIGPKLEEKVADYLKQHEQLRGLLLDGIGSAAVNALAQEACHHVRDEALSQGYQASSPISPGMPGLHISEQQHLFELAPAEHTGVRLAESVMMVPRKSASLVICIGPQMPTWTQEEVCNRCSLKKTCAYRVYPEQTSTPEPMRKT